MPLHPFIAAELAAAPDTAVPYHQLPIEQAREQMKRAYARQIPVPMAEVRDLALHGPAGPIAARLYRPHPGGDRLPLTVFFHGSGFCALDLDTHDEICRRLAQGANCLVVSVNYRLAPEHPFPAGPDDCLAATLGLLALADDLGADMRRLALAGDSAGGCLAVVTAARLRDRAAAQAQGLLLWYPVTDEPDSERCSYRRYAQGYGLSAQAMAWFWSLYRGNAAQRAHPDAAPLRMVSLAGMPATWLMTAEYDVLRDEGQALAERLAQAGVSVESRCAMGLNHGFLKHAGRLPEAAQAMAHACAWLRRQHQEPQCGQRWDKRKKTG